MAYFANKVTPGHVAVQLYIGQNQVEGLDVVIGESPLQMLQGMFGIAGQQVAVAMFVECS